MSAVGHPPPPFFKRGPAPLARLVFFVIVSLALLVIDLRYRTLELARQAVAVALYPLQRAAYAPVELYERAGGYLSSLAALQQENGRLRRKDLEAAGLLLRQQHLEQENLRLRELLDMKARQPVPGIVADILYAAQDPFSRRVVVDRGGRHGVVPGQAVVDEAGVLGQVTRVYPLQSEVTLVTDKNQAVPVEIVRNGLRAVLFGTSGGQMELRYLAANADVQPGDRVVTSGLDGVYLPGLPVARVLRVDRDKAYTFADIACEPVAGVEQHGQVLLLGQRESMPREAGETADGDKKPARAKRPRRKD
ncbi:MAG TPA: rod shape-determining protein MreC [Candidatus Desulfobacillus sp.]|nr:rod shape-determining protein MreC [Candidatus Desulfobacillus sp.]